MQRPYFVSYFSAKFKLSRSGVIWIAEHEIEPRIEFIRPLSAEDVTHQKKSYVQRLISAEDGARLDAFLQKRRRSK